MSTQAKASFKCNQETLDNFRRLVAQKYGRLYGVLETEFTRALNDRIAELQKELEDKRLEGVGDCKKPIAL
jgi:hypothetical protein